MTFERINSDKDKINRRDINGKCWIEDNTTIKLVADCQNWRNIMIGNALYQRKIKSLLKQKKQMQKHNC